MLNAIRERPGLYLGHSNAKFSTFIGFILGYEAGFEAGEHSTHNGVVGSSSLVDNAGFHRFVTERCGRTFPDGGKGWQTFIRENTQSEEEAFELFFDLLSKYEAQQSAVMKTRIRELLKTKPFRPFVILMTSGREHRVTNPCFVMASPNERSMVIIEEEYDDRMHYLSTALIQSVEPVA